MTSIIGALIEAWDELRIHKLRVLLSLVGVAVAVGAMTFVLGIGAIFGQATSEYMEGMMGRQVTVNISATPDGSGGQTGGAQVDGNEVVDTYRAAAERFEIDHSSVVLQTMADIRGPKSTIQPSITLLDPGYQVIHRRTVESGRWLEAGDTHRRAPALVVNEEFLERAGLPPLSEHPTVLVPGDPGFTAEIVGVVPNENGQWTEPQAYALYDSWSTAALNGGVGGEESAGMNSPPSFEAWVPPDLAKRGEKSLREFVGGRLGEGWEVSSFTNESNEFGDLTAGFSTAVLAVGVLVLALGALSLVNITLVTVKHRVREIGIRRSFGATSGRVFFSIMLESVVATAVAGLVGVAMAIWAVRYFPFAEFTGMPIQDVPPLPMSTALTGLAAAVAVGALAGLLPALYAVRIRPVDAIRQ